MRKPLGNITIYLLEQEETDPAREALRQETRKQWMHEHGSTFAKRHMERMSGKQNMLEVIQFFFDSEGRPPANMTLEDLVKQYRHLSSQKRWLQSIALALRGKLEALDAERYHREEAEIAEAERKQQEESDKVYLERVKDAGDKTLLKPIVRDTIRTILLREYRMKQARQALRREVGSAHLLGLRQVESMLSHLFSSTTDATKKMLAKRYDALREGLTDMEITVMELEHKLYDLNEMVESAYLYADSH